MKLLKSLVENKLKQFDSDELNDEFDFWNFYQATNLVKSFNLKDKVYRNKLWKKVLKRNEKSILIMRTLVYKDRKKLYETLSEFHQEDMSEEKMGNFWKSGRFAISSYEYE